MDNNGKRPEYATTGGLVKLKRIFTVLGLVFVAVGILLVAGVILGSMCGKLDSKFVVPGIILAVIYWLFGVPMVKAGRDTAGMIEKEDLRRQKLMKRGECVNARITSVSPRKGHGDSRTYTLTCIYDDEYGPADSYTAEDVMYAGNVRPGDQVKVYRDISDPGNYYVDVETL